jgi:hypothetical protein
VNANDALLTGLTTAQTGSMVKDTAPNAPANPDFDLILDAAAGSALGSSGAPYTLTISAIDLTTVTQPWPAQTYHQAFDTDHGWKLSGTGPDYQCTQTFPVTLRGQAPGGPLAGHVLQYVACLVSPGAQIASILHSDPFVLI